MDVKELTKVGKRCFPLLLILIILCSSASASYWHYLTIGQGDNRYCLVGGICMLEELIVSGNITGNQFYGEMWFHNDSTTGVLNTIISQGVFINVTGFNQITETGQTLNGFIYDNTNEYLSPLVAGMYDCSYDISAGNAGNNQEYQFELAVNGVEQDNTDSHRKIGAQGDVGDAGDRGFIHMVPGDQLTLTARNNDAVANLFVHAASINCVRIGT